MKGKKLLVTLAVSAILFSGCGFKGGNTIIKVNDTKITQGQFDKALEKQMGNSMFAKMGVDLKNNKNTFLINIIKVRVVNDLITKALLEEEMQKRGIKVSSKDVDDAIKDIITKVGSKEQLNQLLKQNGLTTAEFRDGIKDQVKVKKLADQIEDTTVSDADAKKYYNENIQRFKYPEQVKASHILIAANPKDLEDLIKAENEGKELSEAELKAKVEERIKEKKAKAEEILAEVKKDPTQFAKIAKEKSEDPGTAQNGGDLGFFAKGRMVPEFEKAAFDLKPNTLSGIVQTNFGYHIIYVTDRKEAGQEPFEKVENDIKQYMQGEKQITLVDNLLESLKKNSTIEFVDPAYNPEAIQEDIQKQLNGPFEDEKPAGAKEEVPDIQKR